MSALSIACVCLPKTDMSYLSSVHARLERAALPSAHQPGDLVTWQLKAYALTAVVLAVAFIEGKVLYTSRNCDHSCLSPTRLQRSIKT